MSFLVLGLNHQSAKIAVRERLAFSKSELPGIIQKMAIDLSSSGVVVLSTCNRTEIYCDLQDSQTIVDWLCQYRNLLPADLKNIWYVYHDVAAMRHLVRVASGLDSMILGEPQILGQVKDAYQIAQQEQILSADFHKIFQHVFHLAKKVRSATDIGKNAVSVAYAAVGLAKHIFSEVSRSKIIFIGAGEMVELAARHFAEQQASAFFFANRTLANAEALAEKFNASAYQLNELESILSADIIVAATESPEPLVTYDMVKRIVAGRKDQPMLLLDLAVPRNIEEKVNELPDCYLYSVDDLQLLIKENMEQRKAQALLAEEMIDNDVTHFFKVQRTQLQGDKIKNFIDQHDGIAQELIQNLQEFSLDPQALALIEKFSKKAQHQALKFIKDNMQD